MKDAAYGEGERAAERGQDAEDNPYRPGDPRRRAWDEGYEDARYDHAVGEAPRGTDL